MEDRKRITIYVSHLDSSVDFDRVENWLSKWGDQVRIADYSSGGWEHLWDVEAPPEAIAEIPEDWLCASEWAMPALFAKPTFWESIRRFFKQFAPWKNKT